MSAPAPSDAGLLLLAHGSRDPLWRGPTEALAARLRQMQPGLAVACAYLDLCPPDPSAAAAALVQSGARRIRIAPLFLGLGKHAREDLPRLSEDLRLAHPEVEFELIPSLGESSQWLEAAAHWALGAGSGL